MADSFDSAIKQSLAERQAQAQKDSQRIMRDAQVKHDYRMSGKSDEYDEIGRDMKRTPEMREKLAKAKKDSQQIMLDAQKRFEKY